MAVDILKSLCVLPFLFVSVYADQLLIENIVGGDLIHFPEKDAKNNDETKFKGLWELVSENSGVSAMHMMLLPNNKVIMYDATVFGPSKIPLPKGRGCRPAEDPNTHAKFTDCWAHAVEFDIDTAGVRPLKVMTDTWCSSGGLSADGVLLSVGGFQSGARGVRYLDLCDTCDWKDYPDSLAVFRWYSTQTVLPDGRFIVVGGRKAFSYEFIPAQGKTNTKPINFPFLQETTDVDENNLYPFVHLSPDGNLFIFANSRSILLNPNSNQIIREFPVLSGGSRNYPASGMSALLPLTLNTRNPPAEVLICGGAKGGAYALAMRPKPVFFPALQDCGRIQINAKKPRWKKEKMPSRRVMGDMLLLPTGDVLMLNGAQNGTAAWYLAEEPNLAPVIYHPTEAKGKRFNKLAASTIPRMYHSSSAVLPDGRILVGGSNTNNGYKFTNVQYPTELRVEKFSPPYLDPSRARHRPQIVVVSPVMKIKYGEKFTVSFRLDKLKVRINDIKVTMYAPAFTTHGWSMNQRLLVLGLVGGEVKNENRVHQVTAKAPPSANIAPPGYYLLSVVYRGVPSVALWTQIKHI